MTELYWGEWSPHKNLSTSSFLDPVNVTSFGKGVSADITQVGLIPHDKCLCERQERTHTEGKACEDRRRDVALSHGTPTATRTWERQARALP